VRSPAATSSIDVNRLDDYESSTFILEMGVGMFADRWVKALPRRWARNGAIFGAIFSFAQLGGSRDIEQLLQNSGLLLYVAITSVVSVVGSALLFFVNGLWARKALLRSPDREWASVAKSIPLKWTIGAALLGLLIILADAVFEWRGAKLQSGGSINAVVENVGYVVGVVGTLLVLGFAIGLVSRRGLRRAISDDEVASRDTYALRAG
jgi:hypothetical protein